MSSKVPDGWNSIAEALASKLPSDEFETWIRPIQARLDEGCRLVLYAPNPYARDKIQTDYLPLIQAAQPQSIEAITVVIGEAKAAERPRTPPTEATAPVAKKSAPKRGSKSTNESNDGLPQVWANGVRGLSTDLARTAFFTVNRYGLGVKRPRRERMKIFAQKNIELFVSGEETNTFDELVHMQLIHFQRRQPLGGRIGFSLSEVCEELGLPINGQNTQRVLEAIKRLRDTKVELRVGEGDRGFEGQMINDLYYNREEAQEYRYSISFSPAIRTLFSGAALTKISWDTRLRLGQELAQKLHSFFSTHEHVYPLSVEYLYRQSGSNISTLKGFRRKLKEALTELEKVQFLTAWSIDSDDKVHVTRAASHVQVPE